MSDRIGLRSAKGSSTSGYVQKSLAYHGDRADRDGTRGVKLKNYELRKVEKKKTTKHNVANPQKHKALLDHERKREIEVRVSELRDELEDKQDTDPQTWTDEKIDKECEKLRVQLTEEQETAKRYAEAYKPRDKR